MAKCANILKTADRRAKRMELDFFPTVRSANYEEFYFVKLCFTQNTPFKITFLLQL